MHFFMLLPKCVSAFVASLYDSFDFLIFHIVSFWFGYFAFVKLAVGLED